MVFTTVVVAMVELIYCGKTKKNKKKTNNILLLLFFVCLFVCLFSHIIYLFFLVALYLTNPYPSNWYTDAAGIHGGHGGYM